MIICPSCGHENIEGTDTCEDCMHSLTSIKNESAQIKAGKRLLGPQISVLDPHEPVCVPPTATVGDVLKVLYDQKIGCVIVAEDLKPLGIFSERDAMLRLGADYSGKLKEPITQYMTANPESLEMTDKIAFAVHRMDLGGFRHVPITTDGKVVGMISVRDILRFLSGKHVDGP